MHNFVPKLTFALFRCRCTTLYHWIHVIFICERCQMSRSPRTYFWYKNTNFPQIYSRFHSFNLRHQYLPFGRRYEKRMTSLSILKWYPISSVVKGREYIAVSLKFNHNSYVLFFAKVGCEIWWHSCQRFLSNCVS